MLLNECLFLNTLTVDSLQSSVKLGSIISDDESLSEMCSTYQWTQCVRVNSKAHTCCPHFVIFLPLSTLFLALVG